VNESFQFPGKAFLHADSAQRTAEIARLTYDAAVRDAGANAAIACYQLALDRALDSRIIQTINDLQQIAGATRGDHRKANSKAVAAQIAEEQQNQRRLELARGDDEIQLNTILHRGFDEPVELDIAVELKPVQERVDALIERAWSRRQEVLQLAL